jgi:hypothetical protein
MVGVEALHRESPVPALKPWRGAGACPGERMRYRVMCATPQGVVRVVQDDLGYGEAVVLEINRRFEEREEEVWCEIDPVHSEV